MDALLATFVTVFVAAVLGCAVGVTVALSMWSDRHRAVDRILAFSMPDLVAPLAP